MVPTLGNLGFVRKQFWMGTLRAGTTAQIWAHGTVDEQIHVVMTVLNGELSLAEAARQHGSEVARFERL